MDDIKVVPISRVAPAKKTSPQYARRVIRELEDAGEIEPEWTPTGRGYLSVSEWQKVAEALAR